MSDAPKTSVVVTCYNLGRYLDDAVDSVLAQTDQDFEIVIVDDGSTDPATRELLEHYQRPKTRVVHIDNRGLPGARNEGIRQTTGTYVCTLDADDMLERTYLEKSAAVLDRKQSVAFVSHWLKTFGDEEREWTPTSADFPALLDMNTINGAALVRRDALEAVGLYDETMRHGCEDWDLWISMVERGLRGVILPEVLFFYRRRPDSMSRIMMEGATHVGLYQYLIEKHRTSFETHAVDLLLRRETVRTTVLGEAHDLELDCARVLRPEVERLQEEVRVSGHKLERWRQRSEVHRELSRRAQVMTEMDAELSRRAQTMTEMDTELSRRAQTMTEMNTELSRRAQTMTEMDTELSRRATVLNEMNGELARRAAVLAERDAELAHRGQVMAMKDRELAEQQQAIIQRDAELAGRERLLAEQRATLEWGAQALAERDAQLDRLGRTVGEHAHELQQQREGIAGLHHEIQALRASLSWRLTRPLRTVYSWLFERR